MNIEKFLEEAVKEDYVPQTHKEKVLKKYLDGCFIEHNCKPAANFLALGELEEFVEYVKDIDCINLREDLSAHDFYRMCYVIKDVEKKI